MSELAKRVLFAVPAAILFLYITWVGSFYFVALVVLIGIFIQHELSAVMDTAGYKPDPFFVYLIGVWVLLSPIVAHPLLIGLAVFLGFVAVQVFKTGDRALRELISSTFCGLYAPLGLVTLLMVRRMGPPETGFILTLSLLLMVWGNDVFAYFGGKAFGKHKLAPSASPNKTWEGFLFGILGALVGLGLAFYAVPIAFPATMLTIAPATVLVSIFGPIGDLTESRIKRAANVKDASQLLPGHGGVFDRFDALILAAPAFYCYLILLKIIGYVSF